MKLYLRTSLAFISKMGYILEVSENVDKFLLCFNIYLPSSMVVEHLTHNPKVEGLKPAADIGREKIVKKYLILSTRPAAVA
jgi:hypothetical protein